ncbi:MAG TPA: hypothetical protein PLN61_01455 [bacterium]|nr:hypothetical protein [bacterium]HQI47309.1 hypothetical protein [bacterium]HQJ63796.1 hypothetical protein [bacterium]
MKVWQRSKKMEFGKTLLIWRHRAAGRFGGKIFSWLLSGFVLGLLGAVLLNALGMEAQASQFAGRVIFFTVFILGCISAWFRNLVYGLHYRITPQALLYVRPLCGIEALRSGELLHRGDRIEFIPWDEIKSVDEMDGALALTLRNGAQISIGVTPVIALWTPTADGGMEKRIPLGGPGKKSTPLDKEALKLILQKIREIKKTAAARA